MRASALPELDVNVSALAFFCTRGFLSEAKNTPIMVYLLHFFL